MINFKILCNFELLQVKQLQQGSTTEYSQENDILHLIAGNNEIIPLGGIKNEEKKVSHYLPTSFFVSDNSTAYTFSSSFIFCLLVNIFSF